jgi:hypothetical protein
MITRPEIEIVHPAVATWLTENGYTYEHEFVLMFRKRVDFLARREPGAGLLIECKHHSRTIPATIKQVTRYKSMYEQMVGLGWAESLDISLAIAIPKSWVTSSAIVQCESAGIMLIEVEAPVAQQIRLEIDLSVIQAVRAKAQELSAQYGIRVSESAAANLLLKAQIEKENGK